MVATAGKIAKTYASANGSDWVEMDGINACKLGHKAVWLDTTDFKSASTAGDQLGAITRAMGTTSFTVEVSGDFEPEATGQGTLRAAKRGGTAAYIKILPDGSTGFTYQGYMQTQSFNGEAKGKCEATYRMKCIAAPAAV
jgi:hypothetical protein